MGFGLRVGVTVLVTIILTAASWQGMEAAGATQVAAIAVATIVGGAVSTIGIGWANRASAGSGPVDNNPAPSQLTKARPAVVVGQIPQAPLAFLNRAELLAAITDLPDGQRVGVVFAVTGLRGVGKSQLAAARARQCMEDGWRVVAWLEAYDQAHLLAGFARLAVAVGLINENPDPSEAANRIRDWLAAGGDKCLIVLDNAEQPDDLRPYLPAGGHAQVIVTSSRRALASLGVPIPVDIFTEDQAVSFLRERTSRHDEVGALKLAKELGCLPLALAQAAAVIVGQHLDYETYLRRLAAVPIISYLSRPEEDPYPRGTAAAIGLSLDGVSQNDPTGLARQLIEVLALLSSAGATRQVAAACVDGDPAMVDAALQRLEAWSLVIWDVDNSTATVHRLVMRIVREQAAVRGTLSITAMRTIDGLDAVFGGEGVPWTESKFLPEYVDHGLAIFDHLYFIPGLLTAEAHQKLGAFASWVAYYARRMPGPDGSLPDW